MANGICPNCSQASVYKRERGVQIGDTVQGLYIHTSMMTRPSPYVAYLCTSCGRLEIEVTDPVKLAEVSQKWEKVG